MYIINSFIIALIIYIYTFKDDFTKEKFEKVAPVLGVALVIALVITILGNIGS